MIKKIIKRILGIFGLKIIRIPVSEEVPSSPHLPERAQNLTVKKRDCVDALVEAPLSSELHLNCAIQAFESGQPYLAFAELKTAEYLGANRKQIEKYLGPFSRALPEQKSMNHNQFFRFSSLSAEIIKRGGRSGFSILDIGGGEGWLASFVPDISYCLAEPTTNGISGADLPFLHDSFDFVVSCHVLEHIPVNQRDIFLDQLLSKAKQGVILLNPFYIENTFVNERLKLFLEITGADWAREHLECSLPTLQDIKGYAEARNLHIEIKPSGTLTTSLAFVFVDYFAAKSALYDDWKKLNVFINEKYLDILDSTEYPNAYLIYLEKTEMNHASA